MINLLPTAAIVTSNILSVAIVLCYLAILRVIAYLNDRRQRRTGLPPPLSTASRSRDYALGAFAACNVYFIAENPLYAIAPIVFGMPGRPRLVFWNFFSSVAWVAVLSTMRPQVYRHLVSPILIMHATVFYVAFMWPWYRVRTAKLEYEDSLKLIESLRQSPVVVTNLICVVVTIIYYGVFWTLWSIAYVIDKLQRGKHHRFWSKITNGQPLFFLGFFASYWATQIATEMAIRIMPNYCSAAFTPSDYICLALSVAVWISLPIVLDLAISSYISTTAFGVHGQLVCLPPIFRYLKGCENISANNMTIYFYAIVLMVVFACACLIELLCLAHARDRWLARDTQETHGTGNNNASLIEYDVESASAHDHEGHVEDGVSPVSKSRDNTRRSLRIDTGCVPHMPLPTVAEPSQPCLQVAGDEASDPWLEDDNVSPLSVGYGSTYDGPVSSPESQEHSASSAVTTIYIGPPQHKRQDKVSEVPGKEEEVVDTCMDSAPSSESHISEIAVALPNDASSVVEGEVRTTQTTNVQTVSASETLPNLTTPDKAEAHVNINSAFVVPGDEISVSCPTSPHAQRQESVSPADQDSQAQNAATVFKQTRVRPRSRRA